MKKSKERSIWVWSCLKIRRRSVCGVKSLKPGKMKSCAAEKMPGRRFHLKTATDNSGSNISESAMWECDRATVISLQTWSRLCSWAPCSWLVSFELNSYHHHPAGLHTPFWVTPPLSHRSLPHLCVPGYNLSFSGGALMSLSIRTWHCVIQICSDDDVWIEFERIRLSKK